MVDDLLDLVFVLLLNARLPLDMMDDESSSILQDLTVFVGQGQLRTRGWAGVFLRGLLLALWKIKLFSISFNISSKNLKNCESKYFLMLYLIIDALYFI